MRAFGVEGFGVRVEGLGVRVEGSGARVLGLVQGRTNTDL